MISKVGITGNIGSGKSFVAAVFKNLGIPVFNSDEQARELMNSDRELIRRLKNYYGKAVYTSDNKLNRVLLAEKAFSSASEISKLNNLVHPAVRDAFIKWANEINAVSSAPYCLIESALIFEAGFQDMLEAVICVTAPETIRMQRLKERENMTEEQFQCRKQHQWDEEMKIKKSDFIIINDGITPILKQVLDIDSKLRKQ
ncbi:MAG: dephospho-CoA kinase [Bacteroidia bacterium]|nr:dephospho-CoA kinase [Bacteroidia bacterium]MCZ2277350.1 dephospho-CoA kinase [Bacteroidia bacterium]